MAGLDKILGPRAPWATDPETRLRYFLPTFLLTIAALLIIASVFLPYWHMTLYAPQYPGGLRVNAYVNKLTGDVREVNGLNHYIGMRPLEEAAQLERSLSLFAIGVLSLLIISAVFIHTPWAAVLTFPAVLYPAIFLTDLYLWMRNFGLNLDPSAPLSGAVPPFVPPVIGEKSVAQFKVATMVDQGFFLALIASIVILAGLYFHRQAYKPLLEKQARRQ